AVVPAADPQADARYHLAMMEGILETAVQQGARLVSRQWRSVSQEMMLLSGNARARGFKLDGYGIFFDVDVPAMRQSLVWSWRMLDRDHAGATSALESLRSMVKTVADPAQRRELDQSIRLLELQVAPLSTMAGGSALPGDPSRSRPPAAAKGSTTAAASKPGTAAVAPNAPNAPDAANALNLTVDPNEQYTAAVQNALVEAMLDHSQALPIGDNEWLTVAARDAETRRLEGDNAYDVVTILIRIKGSDLAALRAGRITREEARKRVEVREY
ncbi:MAG: hypothetical protein AABY89_09930, partial [Acidobacteriota bacterium]